MTEPMHVQEELTALIDGELAELDRVRVEEHLSECAPCRAERSLLEGAIRVSRTAPSIEPSQQLRRDVLNAISAEPQRLRARLRRLFAPRVLVPTFALAGMGLLLVLAMHGAGPRPFETEEYAVADRLELLEDYELLSNAAAEGFAPEDLEVVTHLHDLGE
jgi:anti-sigma factor RsiW